MYKGLVSDEFKQAVKKLDKEQLGKCLLAILEDPYRAKGSEELRYQYSGFRSARFDQRSRVIFRICEECHLRHKQEEHPLDCCKDDSEDKDLKVVRFVDFGDYHRKSRSAPRLKKDYTYVEIVALVPNEENPTDQAGNT